MSGSHAKQGRIVHCLAIAQTSVRLQDDSFLCKGIDGILAIEEWINLNLIYQGWKLYPAFLEFQVILEGVIGYTQALDFSFFLQDFESFVRFNMLSRDGPMNYYVDE